MQTAIRIAILALLIVATLTIAALGWYGSYALRQWAGVGSSAAATLTAVNRPCSAMVPCGTLADVNRTLATVRGTFGQIEVAARHENRQLGTLDRQERQLFADLHGTATQAQGTLSTLAGTAQALTATANEATATTKAVRPVLGSLGATADASTTLLTSANSRVTDARIDALITHLQGISASADGIAADGRKVADKITTDYIAPQPWWKRLSHYAGDGFDFAALAARHIP